MAKQKEPIALSRSDQFLATREELNASKYANYMDHADAPPVNNLATPVETLEVAGATVEHDPLSAEAFIEKYLRADTTPILSNALKFVFSLYLQASRVSKWSDPLQNEIFREEFEQFLTVDDLKTVELYRDFIQLKAEKLEAERPDSRDVARYALSTVGYMLK